MQNLKAAVTKPLVYIPLLFAALFCFHNIIHFGVNTPYWDQWEMVPRIQALHTHTQGFNDLWAAHNEHRIFFPWLVSLTLAMLTHWNIGVEIMAGFGFALISSILLALITVRTIRQPLFRIMAIALISFWFFSPIQAENWIWGWQLEWFMVIAAVITTIFLLTRTQDLELRINKALFAAAIISAGIATFSLAAGIFVWIIGLGILLAQRSTQNLQIHHLPLYLFTIQ
jgi:hypothetical protein